MITFKPTYSPPNFLYRDPLQLNIGGVPVQVRHGRGETDDHSWVYFPAARVICTGDFFIWAMPNAGNPQKVQRYALEWARTLRVMATLRPKVLVPGHGLLILGEERVSQALDDTAAFLELVHDQTVGLINRGLPLDEVVRSVRLPGNLCNRPYLQPVHDEAEFIVRNIWRYYGGRYDGRPSHLKPAPEKAQAEEIAALAGGVKNLVRRAEELMATGNYRLATHLAEWAYLAAPDDPAARISAQRVYKERTEVETSQMARGIFAASAVEIQKAVESAEEEDLGPAIVCGSDEPGA